MKKLFALVLAAVMMLSLVSCGGGTSTFVMEDDGQTMEIKVTYSKDVVEKMECTIEAELTDEMEGSADMALALLTAAFESLEEYDFCEIDTDKTDDAVIVSIVFNDLDDPDNLEKLGDMDMFGIDDVDETISYKELEENLIDEGYEKK